MKLIVTAAVIFGLIIGISFAVIQGNSSGGDQTGNDASTATELDPKKLPPEVLKALPPEELAEIFPEKADAILNPDSASQINPGGKDSDDPEYLRAVIEKLGGEAPADASTKELQDILANLSVDINTSGK